MRRVGGAGSIAVLVRGLTALGWGAIRPGTLLTS